MLVDSSLPTADTVNVTVVDQQSEAAPLGLAETDRGSLGKMVKSIPFAAATAVWVVATGHAWQLRSIVQDYESTHGEARLLTSTWPEHLRQLHDDMMGVGADYFYPFAFGTIVVIALAWIGSLALLRTSIPGLRGGLAGLGLLVLVSEWMLFAATLQTYVRITD